MNYVQEQMGWRDPICSSGGGSRTWPHIGVDGGSVKDK